MRPIIKQSITLPAPAKVLFATYLDPARHEAMTGAPVTIGSQPGAPFSAFGGQITGHNLAVVEPTLIIQSWRSTNFAETDPDSTLILSFVPDGENGRIDLFHLDVPEQDFQGVSGGWEKYYWTPWKHYLGQD